MGRLFFQMGPASQPTITQLQSWQQSKSRFPFSSPLSCLFQFFLRRKRHNRNDTGKEAHIGFTAI